MPRSNARGVKVTTLGWSFTLMEVIHALKSHKDVIGRGIFDRECCPGLMSRMESPLHDMASAMELAAASST